MKRVFRFLAFLAVFALASALISLRAQDAPPPPDDQNAPPPPMDDQGAQPPPDAGGDDQGVSYQTFYDNLGNDGSWIQTDDYGYVFQPNVDDPNWAPYTDGHWAYSDDGWVWVSDEPWGWATYHYGRWANLDTVGWVWVPGYQWAPAWVSWRYGGGYCGWAPLPPGADYGRGGPGGFHFGGDVDANFHIGAGYYNFVPQGRMGDPNMRGAIIDRSHNFTVINRTTNITNINVGQNFGQRGNGAFHGVTAGGPPIAEINAHATHHVATVQLSSSNAPGTSAVHGNSLAIYAPHVNAATAHQARPAAVTSNVGRATINPGNSASRPLTANTHARSTASTPAGTSNAGQAFHPQAETGSTVHPQSQSQGEVTHPTETSGASHTESGSEVEHHTETPAIHSQSESGGEVEHHTEAPAHPQSEVEHHAEAPASHPQGGPAQHAAAPHPAAKPAGKPGEKDDKKH